MMKKRVLIMGAAGRDFHNFNTVYRDNDDFEVVAFTATQIPNILGRKYPAALAGSLYPDGIPIFDEKELENLIAELKVDDVVFSYSDIPYDYVMHKSAIVNTAGANFVLLGCKETSLSSTKPLISVGATRTGCGKSQTSRRIVEVLMEKGLKVVAVRHPMPYGDLEAQKVQRYAVLEDLEKHDCTVEEMEEYEPHIVRGNVIYSGVDYEAILRAAENDPDGCDVIVWDGGNNDFPFYKSDLHITVTDPHRAGHGLQYYPGEITLRMSDAVIINKIDTARPEDVEKIRNILAETLPEATVIDAASPVRVDSAEIIRNKKVLVVEDGPTLTHGGMMIGAGMVAARKYGAAEMVDPRPYLVGQLKDTFDKYPGIGTLLPAMGYGDEQLKDLETTINNCECDAVIIGTPIDLNRIINIKKPSVRVYYDLQSIGTPRLEDVINKFVDEKVNINDVPDRPSLVARL
ncbi:MAG: cyclic 2,3-diphosphoglycerate synthase [Bacteroidia bacterium]|nr:cyclic 2,3-diphosphoglycerate synthase [Bacteroidia bacterium]MBT8276713.1 cyclic 2,3-diphosphoglycerate synthase [Bacteroidia bacterium]NNF31657.1 GTPase [Flavobacteriaceae bacterium]NNK55171.1 GTPase [Flavobacteriaceae bacterium]NNM10166.1 GTPase [Flavobacteriaceae bacterium]